MLTGPTPRSCGYAESAKDHPTPLCNFPCGTVYSLRPPSCSSMPATSSAMVAAQVALAEALVVANSSGVAVDALLLYDTLLCFIRVVQLVWSKKTSLASVLYIINRYIPLIGNLLGSSMINTVSDTSCTILGWTTTMFALLAEIGPPAFATMRMYALSGRNGLLCGMTLLLSFVPFFINLCVAPQAGQSPTACELCALLLSGHFDLSYVRPSPLPCQLCMQSQTVCRLTCYPFMNQTDHREPRLHDTGRLYGHRRHSAPDIQASPPHPRRIATTVAASSAATEWMHIFRVITVGRRLFMVGGLIDINTNASYVTAFIDPISSILNSRFLLNLREANEKLTAGGSSISQGSVWFAGPNLALGEDSSPTRFTVFASSLAGPVYLDDENDDGCEAQLAENTDEGTVYGNDGVQ
ncbi:hypothetical protein OH77DRAFT_1487774 [Trametes cingulata]|nr:hypothetical protein OH77DRAFT_1487774 [Trametes cingulata]